MTAPLCACHHSTGQRRRRDPRAAKIAPSARGAQVRGGSRRSPGGPFDPSPLIVATRHLRVGHTWVATLVITGYPHEAYPGWLAPLTNYPALVDVSVHIDPMDPALATQRLRRQLARLESGRRSTSDHGRLADPHVDAATEDAYDLAARVARGEGRLFTLTLTLTVHAPTAAQLDDDVAALQALAASLLLDARRSTHRALTAWTTGLPFGLDGLSGVGGGRVMDTDALAAAFPFTSPDLHDPHQPDPHQPDPHGNNPHAGQASGGAPDGVLYGHNLASPGLVFWNRFGCDNYNSVILGRSGSGKSYLVKLELLRSLYRGITAHVIDPEDEYRRLADAIGATTIALGSPGVALNPFDLPIHTHPDTGVRTAAPDTLTKRALFLHTVLAVLLATTPTANERAVLDTAITTTYTRAGITDHPATWTLPAPLLSDLHTVLLDLAQPPTTAPRTLRTDRGSADTTRTTQDHADTTASGSQSAAADDAVPESASNDAELDDADHGDADLDDDGIDAHNAVTVDPYWAVPDLGEELRSLAAGLATRLRPFVDGAFAAFLDRPTTTPPEGHLVVWSLRELAEELKPVATLLCLDHLWRHVTHPHDRRPRLITVDEAWLLMRQPEGAQFLLRAAKSSRKYWAGLTIATQDTADILSSDLGKAVIANAATQILLRQAPQAIDQITTTFNLSAGERAFLLAAERGDGLLCAGTQRAAFTATASVTEDHLITTDPHALTARDTTAPAWITLDPEPAPLPRGRQQRVPRRAPHRPGNAHAEPRASMTTPPPHDQPSPQRASRSGPDTTPIPRITTRRAPAAEPDEDGWPATTATGWRPAFDTTRDAEDEIEDEDEDLLW